MVVASRSALSTVGRVLLPFAYFHNCCPFSTSVMRSCQMPQLVESNTGQPERTRRSREEGRVVMTASARVQTRGRGAESGGKLREGAGIDDA